MTGQTDKDVDSLLRLSSPRPDVPDKAITLAKQIEDWALVRTSIPLRWSFTHASQGDAPQKAPMARLIAAGGRGGAVPVKLLIGLIWRSARPPHETNSSARQWAELLGLPAPETSGARRVAAALHTLEEARLVRITHDPGEPSIVRILDESGNGADYTLPSTAYYHANTLLSKAKDPERVKQLEKELDANRYTKIPLTLWTNGHIQAMSSSALAMLLSVLTNSYADQGAEVWWTTENFPDRYGISPATRARGTKELVDRGLLQVSKRGVANSPNNKRPMAPVKVRNIYTLINDAVLPPKAASEKSPAERARRPSSGRGDKRKKTSFG